VNNIISTRRALTDLDNSQLQLNRHIAFIYVVIVFYLLSKARVLAGTSVSAPLQSGWFDVCWISLLSPCLVGLRGVKKNKGKPSRGDFPGVCSSRKHASKSIQFDGTCVQSPSNLVGGGNSQMVPWRSSSSTLSWYFILVDICVAFSHPLSKGCH